MLRGYEKGLLRKRHLAGENSATEECYAADTGHAPVTVYRHS